MTSVIVRLVGDSLSSEVSRPGSMAAAVYSVSQKPLIITKTCRKLGRFGPLNNSMMGDLLPFGLGLGGRFEDLRLGHGGDIVVDEGEGHRAPMTNGILQPHCT